MLSMAYRMYYMDDDIGLSRRLTFPKEIYHEIDIFSLEETKATLEATKMEPIHIRVLIELALFTALRRGELVGLKWSDIEIGRASCRERVCA